MVEGDAPGLKRRRLTPLSFGWGSPRTRPRGTVTPPRKKREQNLDSSVCLRHHVSWSRQPLATVLVALLTDILDVFAAFILQLQGWTTFDGISRCHALIRRARTRLSTFKHHSGHCPRVLWYSRADDGTLHICMSVDRSLVSDNGGHEMLVVTG